MREAVELMVREMISPVLDRLEDISSEAEDLRRRMQNIIRLGYVKEVDSSGTKIKVAHGKLETPFIRWFSSAAGETIDYRCPSVGEQVVLVNYGSGDGGSQTMALIGVHSEAYPFPTSDPKEILRVYPDGTRVSYHSGEHLLKIDVEGDAEVNVKENATVKAQNLVKIEGSKVHVNGGVGVVTGAHRCMVTGLPHGDCSTQVTAGK